MYEFSGRCLGRAALLAVALLDEFVDEELIKVEDWVGLLPKPPPTVLEPGLFSFAAFDDKALLLSSME